MLIRIKIFKDHELYNYHAYELLHQKNKQKHEHFNYFSFILHIYCVTILRIPRPVCIPTTRSAFFSCLFCTHSYETQLAHTISFTFIRYPIQLALYITITILRVIAKLKHNNTWNFIAPLCFFFFQIIVKEPVKNGKNSIFTKGNIFLFLQFYNSAALYLRTAIRVSLENRIRGNCRGGVVV